MSALPSKADLRGVTPAGGIFLTEPSSLRTRQARSSAARTFAALADMRSKTEQIHAAWSAGDRIGALRIAAQFFDCSNATKTFQRGMAAYNHPQFYRQIGKEPQELVTVALALLAKQFDLR